MTEGLHLGERMLRVHVDVECLPVDGGVAIKNTRGHFIVKGAGSYELCRVLLERLSGEENFTDVLATFGEEKRATIARVVDRLWRHRFVSEASKVDVSPFSTDLDGCRLFLEQYCDDAAYRSETVATTRLDCFGASARLLRVLSALINVGFTRFDVNLDATSDAREFINIVQREPPFRATHLQIELVNAPDVATSLKRRPGSVNSECLKAVIGAEGSGNVKLIEYERFFVLLENDYEEPERFAYEHIDKAERCVSAEVIAVNLLAARLLCRVAGVPLYSAMPVSTINKKTLVVEHYKEHLPFDRVAVDTLVSIDAATDGGIALRRDIPAASDQGSELDALEAINNAIPFLVNPVYGPLVDLSEHGARQFPLAVSSCRFFRRTGSALIEVPLRCSGVSARECRNQTVLFGIEEVCSDSVRQSDVLDRRNFDTSGAIVGAGWSCFEALFRATRKFLSSEVGIATERSVHWSRDSDVKAFESQSNLRSFLLKAYVDATGSHPTIEYADAGSYVCARYVPANAAEGALIDIGLSREHACLNLLCALVARATAPGDAPGLNRFAMVWSSIDESAALRFCESTVRRFRVFRLQPACAVLPQVKSALHIVALLKLSA